jgi:hypothetical protein
MNEATAKTIFFRRQAEKSSVFFEVNLQKLTYCRNAMDGFLLEKSCKKLS